MQPSPDREPVGLLIAAIRRRLRQATGRVARRFRLPPQQFWVLVAILETDGPSLRGLADRLRIDEPTASRLVAQLVRKRLVRAETDAADRRRTHLVPTPAGLALRDDLLDAARGLRRATLDGFTAAEADALRDALRRVLANLERAERPAGERSAAARPAADRPLEVR